MDEIKSKQQVIEKLKQAEKVLVTVSKNPSVDALSAALGLTLLLDGQGKYTTAIFSGETPPALAFLEPEKTFDDTTDSLRDFIIALNKEKADHLRYKVVDDAVKIFITPYKTTITEDDLEFSQGDYNVELVIAIGVDSQDDLDAALDNHGQILHDAAIITVTAGDQTSTLGGIDWYDAGASSLSEMIASLADGLKEKGDKHNKLLTESVATSLLTGIVAETDRFSNERTSSKAMTIAATLMAAGADQQLIANELQNAKKIEFTSPVDFPDETPQTPDEPVDEPESVTDGKGGLTIRHDPSERPAKVAPAPVEVPEQAPVEDAREETMSEIESRVRGISEAELEAEEEALEAPSEDDNLEKPQFGGVLNATSALAAADAREIAESDQNRTILSHQYLDNTESEPGQAVASSLSDTAVPSDDVVPEASAYAVTREKVIEPLSEQPVAPAEPAINAYAPDPVAPPVASPEISLPMPPPIPDFSQMGAPAPALPLPPTETPQILGDILNPAIEAQVQNAYGVASAYATETAAVQPAQQVAEALAAATPEQQATTQPSAAYAADPGQFQIPQ